ncbi:MAG: hypothetical protein AAFN74_03840, partial [Myxococcota bacterium]
APYKHFSDDWDVGAYRRLVVDLGLVAPEQVADATDIDGLARTTLAAVSEDEGTRRGLRDALASYKRASEPLQQTLLDDWSIVSAADNPHEEAQALAARAGEGLRSDGARGTQAARHRGVDYQLIERPDGEFVVEVSVPTKPDAEGHSSALGRQAEGDWHYRYTTDGWASQEEVPGVIRDDALVFEVPASNSSGTTALEGVFHRGDDWVDSYGENFSGYRFAR